MRTPGPPKIHPKWNSSGQNLNQINDLLVKINDSKKNHLTGASVVLSWIARQVQPLQKHVSFGFRPVSVGVL